jgi:hypothetical protein
MEKGPRRAATASKCALPRASKADADRREELTFKTRRILMAEVEAESLFYAFSCARLLFKGDGSREEEEVALSVDKMLS